MQSFCLLTNYGLISFDITLAKTFFHLTLCKPFYKNTGIQGKIFDCEFLKDLNVVIATFF